ncbi:hypothetical protein SSPS47_31030 [Streptomyces sp. S4.7]|uniref:hypothetical protein n=1 Tax=Streptomyces sp. S4.7 TaxID=2705439 RepID=UPI0013973A2F|nr:hypothetical protein [Streptomyces sp. S4.7]QHY99544.1 hypothetical protein SSPS47_31030 [Streptomyces sp. S4.7]
MNGVVADDPGTLSPLMARQPVNVRPPWNETVAPPCGNVKPLTFAVDFQAWSGERPLLLSLPLGDT